MRIPATKVWFPEEDREEILAKVQDVLSTGQLTLGKYTKEFEKNFASYAGTKYAVAVNSGTSALEIILRAISIKSYSVVVPTNTFFATPASVLHADGKVIFIDTTENLCLDPESLKKSIREDTKAVIIVHIAGIIPPQIEEIRQICQTHGLFLIEDAAHAQGSTLNEKMAGSFGKAAAFSFYPTKIMTSGEEGMIVTNDEKIYERALVLRDQGKANFYGNVHTELGYNWRMSEIHYNLRIRFKSDLIAVSILAVILVMVISFYSSAVPRIVLGLPFLVFFPGYTLMAVLFPKKEEPSPIARVAMSFGMSIAITSLIGLALNYTRWGIRLEPLLYSIASFIFTTAIIAWLRRRRLPEDKRFGIELRMKAPDWAGSIKDKALSIALVVSIASAVGALSYTFASPRGGDKFTEFYVLGLSGEATNYPQELEAGEEVKLIGGIINQERETISYRVEIRVAGIEDNQTEPIELEHDKKWEQLLSFTPHRTGSGQKVEFLLYKDPEQEPYRQLHLWLDVVEDRSPAVSLDDYSDGIFSDGFIAESYDDTCRLSINPGTTGMTQDGEPLSELTIARMEHPPPPPADFSIIDFAYALGPDGATFNPPITLTLSYYEILIPDGMTEDNLALAMWDRMSEEWVIADDYVADQVTNTITAPIAHLATFAVLVRHTPAPSPAAFAIADLAITPREANIGEEVIISVLVTNTGDLVDTYRVTLEINNVGEAQKDTTLAGGFSQTVTFTSVKDTAGTYTVDINGLSDIFEVKAPPSPQPAPPTGPNWWVIGSISAAGMIVALVMRWYRKRLYG